MLEWRRENHLCRVAGNTVWSYMTSDLTSTLEVSHILCAIQIDVYFCSCWYDQPTNVHSTESISWDMLRIACVGYFKMSGKVVHIIPSTGYSVAGIAILNDQLHVGLHGRKAIAIYCPTTFQHQRNCTFTDTQYGQSLRSVAVCNTNNCLYASDQQSNWVFKINGQNYSSSCWSSGSTPQGLSMTSSHNVLIAVTGSNSLREYSTAGQRIREINLQPAGITTPVHAVQLSDELYAVTHHGPKHQFSIVNSAGQIVRSYSGDAGDLNEPRGIVDDKKGRVLVADQNNNRVLVINPKTLSAYPLHIPDCQLQGRSVQSTLWRRQQTPLHWRMERRSNHLLWSR